MQTFERPGEMRRGGRGEAIEHARGQRLLLEGIHHDGEVFLFELDLRRPGPTGRNGTSRASSSARARTRSQKAALPTVSTTR